jgi:glucose/arabinose dehydrogenase
MVTPGSSYIHKPSGVQAATGASHQTRQDHRMIPARTLPLALCLLVGPASACGSGDGSPVGPPDGTVQVGLEPVASGLSFPLYLTAPAGDARLFIVEKGGAIRIVKDGALLPVPFLSLAGRVSTGGEQGLLGLAFDPAYATSGRFVVHYTDASGNTVVSMFRVSAGDPDQADPASEAVLLTVEQPFANHNGGQILFGPDGMLYIGLGDGGSEGDPAGRGQSLTDLLGDILRVDVASGAGYTVPPDNPFVGRTDARPEIWSYGLRNPWRFTFDPPTGDLYIADVGGSAWEEVDVVTAAAGAGRGTNFGWAATEGSHCHATSGCDPSAFTLPVLEYSHDEGCSITGGFVYRGAAIPALQGHYFYADYCRGWVRSFRLQDGQAVEPQQWGALAPGGPITSFGQDAAGELYILTAEGVVSRIAPR